MDPKHDSTAGLLQVSLQGTPHQATGTVQGSTPVLQELSGATFKQPAPLCGPVLIYRANASEPSVLPVLTGEFPASPLSRGDSRGDPTSALELSPSCSREGAGVAGRDKDEGLEELEQRT